MIFPDPWDIANIHIDLASRGSSAEKRSQQPQISMGQNVLSMVSVLNLICTAQVACPMCELPIAEQPPTTKAYIPL